jgi:hypothetical protein
MLNDVSAAPGAAPAAPGPAASAGADEGGEDTQRHCSQSEQGTMQPSLEDVGVIERVMRNTLCTRQCMSSSTSTEQEPQQPRQRDTDIEEHEIRYRSTKLRIFDIVDKYRRSIRRYQEIFDIGI